MEAVAVAASIAGIVSLLGESLKGTKKLRDFFSDMSSASRIMSQILGDIDSLLSSIQSIKELCGKLPQDFEDTHVILLQVQLGDYEYDVCRWLTIASTLRPASEKGMKAWLKKSWVAVNMKCVNEMAKELARYKQTFILNLSILGR